jgi:hypothetical protein
MRMPVGRPVIRPCTRSHGHASRPIRPSLLPGELAGTPALDAIRTLPGVIGAIDTARGDPDDLYVTTDTAGGRGSAIWHAPGTDTHWKFAQPFVPGADAFSGGPRRKQLAAICRRYHHVAVRQRARGTPLQQRVQVIGQRLLPAAAPSVGSLLEKVVHE